MRNTEYSDSHLNTDEQLYFENVGPDFTGLAIRALRSKNKIQSIKDQNAVINSTRNVQQNQSHLLYTILLQSANKYNHQKLKDILIKNKNSKGGKYILIKFMGYLRVVENQEDKAHCSFFLEILIEKTLNQKQRFDKSSKYDQNIKSLRKQVLENFLDVYFKFACEGKYKQGIQLIHIYGRTLKKLQGTTLRQIKADFDKFEHQFIDTRLLY